MKDKIRPIIMAGGTGSRLWPMSRTQIPKQYLKLVGDRTMLQETVVRLSGLDHLPVSVICNQEHRFLVAEQLREVAVGNSGILLEPSGRNTAPAVALAAFHSLENNEDPLLLVLAADHLIMDIEAFQTSIEKSCAFAQSGQLVTFGIVPDKPETGYGYIRRGNKLFGDLGFQVDSFVEKPNLVQAIEYVESDDYYWNSGMFMFKASRYLEELEKYRPDIFAIVKDAYSKRTSDFDFIRVDSDVFERCPDESIDYAVMESTSDAVVVPLEAGWSDVGAWSSLWEISHKDDDNNVINGDVLIHNSSNCYINSSDRLISAVGVQDLVIVDTKDALLVADKNKVQGVKNIVNLLKTQGRTEFQQHREVYRPWGKHDHVAEGSRYHVKKVTINPGERTAMQLHHHRSEHWIIVSGSAKVFKDESEYLVTENQSIYIPLGTKHCIENPGKVILEIIEVRTGTYLDEDDVVRFEKNCDIGY
ncbi:mannose-1-phosphate guanylyltransferase/mannose-6-phosphate isomerase [Vibrio ostreicida]|uniref:mannose-1-phosphate guanylyltransferase/mannose-6-phosphate isomerase n=1 Tax=Vibrio ostreicida TaxID=526588 RepID=UPI0009711242|nr:mannose-1-phosphate guanylyltransferase/mannose-6-phosphate isomerase [Vibrio ostreicida]